jgi:outer membrane protein assembly factor BamB
VAGGSLTLDGSGNLTLQVQNPYTIPAQTTETFFVDVLVASNTTGLTPPLNTFTAKITPGAQTVWLDVPSGIDQPATQQGLAVAVSSPYIISPSSAPANTSYPTQVSTPGLTLNNVAFYTDDNGNNSVYAAGTSDGNMYALNNNGAILWTFPVGGAVTSIYDPNNVDEIEGEPYLYIATNNGLINKLLDNGASGASEAPGWDALDLGSPVTSDILYYGLTTQFIYVGTQDGSLYRILTTGSLDPDWDFDPGINGGVFGTPVIDENATYNDNGLWFGTMNGSFYRLNNGDNGSITSSYSPATSIQTSAFYIAGNTKNMYFGDDSGALRCRNASNLTTIPAGWTDVHVSSPIRSSPFADIGYPGASNAIYFGCDNGKFYKVDITSGTILWTFQTGGPIRTNPVVGNMNDVYFGSDDGYFYGLNLSSGAFLPNYPIQTGAAVRGSPVFDGGYTGHHIYHDWIIFSSNDGKVYSIDIYDPDADD